MEITLVSSVLTHEGVAVPTFNALIPNENNYRVLLMQPRGLIEASAAGVRNRDRADAHQQFGKFLDDARETQADLVVTPEYSMPWETLIQSIKEDNTPTLGKLWALGCESIKYSELEALKQDLAPFAALIFEPMQPDPTRFTDPLAYVFRTSSSVDGGPERIVVLVQFKTSPMGDDDHFEINGLQRGSRIYQFGGVGQELKLVSLICSDAFAFQDTHAAAIYDRALVLHIQLNPKPRQELYRQYRDRLMGFHGDATELVCLNWAGDVYEWCQQGAKPWHNIAGSAWYLRPDKFDERDSTLCSNHRRGLYYTWLKTLRVHVLFFNYKPATFLLEATKVAHVGVSAAISRRRGPLLTKACVWDDGAATWVEQVVAEDGLLAIVDESGHAADEIRRVAADNPLATERILALCAGKITHSEEWHGVRQLDSCVIDASEVIHRVTFCQDTDEHACEFRIARLKRCGRLWDILKTDDQMPAALSDFKQGFRFEWSSPFPHQNAVSVEGKRATVIYMGEEVSTAKIEATLQTVAEYLRRSFSDPDMGLMARQRLAVWFRHNEEIVLCDPLRYVKIDQTGETSEFDIGRES